MRIVRKRRHSAVVQVHHISYIPEVTVRIWKGEHFIIHMLLRRKRISKGFIEALRKWLAEHESQAVELNG